jgi:RNA polymerase sigma factor (TIGR02999 family)
MGAAATSRAPAAHLPLHIQYDKFAGDRLSCGPRAVLTFTRGGGYLSWYRPRTDRLIEASGPRQETVTRLLQELRAGDPSAIHDLFPLVYDELHQAAERQRRRWQGDETLNATALVHEAYLKLLDVSAPEWHGRSHFLAVAATAMRQILIDYAKAKRTAKRGGGTTPLPLHEIEAVIRGDGDPAEARDEALIALDDSLRRLESLDPRQARIVECRFFAGMTITDTAEALEVSPATVKRGWAMAQAWLYRDLKRALKGSA